MTSLNDEIWCTSDVYRCKLCGTEYEIAELSDAQEHEKVHLRTSHQDDIWKIKDINCVCIICEKIIPLKTKHCNFKMYCHEKCHEEPLDERDIDLVSRQAKCSKEVAAKFLIRNDGDLVLAILEIESMMINSSL